MNKKIAFRYYLLFIHICLIIYFFNYRYFKELTSGFIGSSIEWNRTQQITHAFNLRVDKNTSSGKVLFIGDSHIQGLAVNEISELGINFGIGRDTSNTILTRIKQYQSLRSAKIVVLAFGVNDFNYRTAEDTLLNYKKVIKAIPEKTLVVVNALFYLDSMRSELKVSNSEIALFNDKLEKLTQHFSNSTFLNINKSITDDNQLSRRYHVGDGLHLNENGYQIWINALNKIIRKEI
jgi:lysophospholipase L1-like esterase